MTLKLVLLLPLITLLGKQSFQRVTPIGDVVKVVGRNKTKLCGSMLRNAIIYSCGASRWKREAVDLPLPESVQTNSNKILENVKLQSTLDPELKQQGNGPLGKETLLTDSYEYNNDNKINIPEVKEDLAWKSEDLGNVPELKQLQHHHTPDAGLTWTQFFQLYNVKEDIVAGAEDAGWKSPGQKGLASPTGSDFPQAKVRRKHDLELEMAMKCCDEGCTAQDIASAFCLN